ncbi:unnamed protein product [Merluccius merluccius]
MAPYKAQRFECANIVSVSCGDNIELRLKDRCWDWKRLVLKSKEGGRACEGMVFMYSKDDPKVVSSQGWTQKEGQRLCQDLGCGSYQNHSEEEPDGLTMWGTFNCSGVDKPKNIWECMQSEQAAVNKRLYLQCQEEDVPGGRAAEVTALHVNCLGSEGQLGQCMVSSATCKNPLVSVFCIAGFCLRRDMEVDSGDYDNAGSSVNEKSSLGRVGEWSLWIEYDLY